MPTPSASANIAVAKARAPSGASSTAAIPATTRHAFTNARVKSCAPVKTSNDGASPAIKFAMHAPASEKQDELAAPEPVGERDHHERHQHADSRDREREAERFVGLVERVGDRVTVLRQETATEVGDERDERQRGQARGLLGRERNRRHDRPPARRRRWIAALDAARARGRPGA